MTALSLLTILWALPLVGGALALVSGRKARELALLVSAASLVFSAWLLLPMNQAGGVMTASHPLGWGFSYALLLDGLALPLCWLTAFLTVICVIASWKHEGGPGYWAAFLALEATLLGLFLARDFFLFYVFWEAVLVPMFFIIGLWGSSNRRHAAVKFFLFTFFGGVFLLVGALGVVIVHYHATGVWTWDLTVLRGPAEGRAAVLMFMAIVVGLAVKIPLVPLHTWLPDAHTEAPAAGSVMLAGVMLKMGTYGFIRVLWPLFPQLTVSWLPVLGAIAAANVIYGALCAMAQRDLKRLIAYSSVAHLGFCVLGILSGTPEGLTGGSLQMINHGLTTGALFLLVGFMYDRTHKRGLEDYGGLVARAPWMTLFFGFSVMASIGLPGLNGFVGEFMCLSGIAQAYLPLLLPGMIGVLLAAGYLLPAYTTVFWGAEGPASSSPKVHDLDVREKGILFVLCLLMLVLGLYPAPLLNLMEPALRVATFGAAR